MAEKSSPADLTPNLEVDATAPGAEGTTDAAASSSEAPKGETKETLLEAVLKAVKQPEDGDETPPTEASPSSKGPDGAETPATKGVDLTKDPTPEELASYKKGTRERMEYLLNERKSLRTEVDSLKNEADVTRVLRDFLVVNDIAREDFQLTLDLAAAMRRGDFRTFLDGVAPYVQLATQALGITLPTDLQNDVQAGRVNFEAAAQISRERYARALSDQRAARATQVLGSQQDYQQRANFARSIEQTVTEWENGVRQTDPDYARKEETVRNFLWAVIQEQGNPQSPEHAVAIAKEAYARANSTLRQFAPPPRATRPVPSSVSRPGAPGAYSEPKSMMEAAMLGLERARSG